MPVPSDDGWLRGDLGCVECPSMSETPPTCVGRYAGVISQARDRYDAVPCPMEDGATRTAPLGSTPPTPRTGAGGGRFVAGTILAERYRIVALVGRGGMGEVYKADDLKLDHPVALKFLPETIGLNTAALERFHAEARIARQVSHPNVCRVYDIGDVDGLHFLTMELIDGEDVSSLLRRIGRLPADKALEIARQ